MPQEDVNKKARDVYELRDLDAPNVSGLALKLFTSIIEHPVIGYLVRKSVFRSSGFEAFRQRAQRDQPRVEPTDLPLHLPQPSTRESLRLSDIDAFYNALLSRSQRSSRKRPSIREYHEAYRAKRITPLQVAEALLHYINLSNEPPHSLNAVIRLNPDQLLRDARASSARWASGAPLSVLDGVPFTVKDMLDVAGYATRGGSGFPPTDADRNPDDADVVKALRDAGMLMVGKCNQDELGIGVRGFSMFSGQTRNPHNTEYVPGGSSSGSGVAVATGLCVASVCSDAGGSTRIPAACCGVYSIKPTFARLSTRGRLLTAGSDDDELSPVLHVGPIAGCAEDLAIVYYALAAFAPHRPIPPACPEFAPHMPPRELSASVSGLRIGVCQPWVESAQKRGVAAAKDVIRRMVEAGATEVPVAIPDLEDIRVALPVGLMDSAIRALTKAGLYGKGNNDSIGYDARGKLAMGCEFSDSDKQRSRVVRSKAIEHVKRMFREVDLLVTPALGCDVPKVPTNLTTGVVDIEVESQLMRFMLYGNLTGLPACIFPVGREDSGVPCAVQAIGRPWEEETLLRVCLWAQQEYKAENLEPRIVFNALDGREQRGIASEAGGR